MQDPVFQILFLGEDLAWSKVSRAIAEAPAASLKVHRPHSLNELFLVLAGGNWQAVVLDVHAWQFQGLHSVEKIRSEYPALPIIALYSPALPDLEAKAATCGASRTLILDEFTADALRDALVSCISEHKSRSHFRKASPMHLKLEIPETAPFPTTKNQIISHALSNLLCVISANADLLADHVNSNGPGTHSLSEIKRAARLAADLMRHIK